MTTPTSRGLRDFDHTTLAAMPEYAAAQMALDLLAHALRAAAERGQYQCTPRDFQELVAQMAAVLPYSDACPADHTDDGERGIIAPHAIDLDGDWLTGRYYCPTHERVWTCGYAVAAPDYL